MKKRILIVSRAFYPLIAPRSFRATELAKEFARLGHEVTVYTHNRNFDYTSFEKEFGITVKDFVKGKWCDLPKSNNIFIRLLKGALKYFFIFPDIQLVMLIQKALIFEKDYDLLISIAIPYPVHWGVAKAIKKNKKLTKTWVADCGDPFMGNKEQKVKFPFYFHFVEDWFCTKPDYITIPIEESRNAYPLKCHDKIKIIPQGFNFNINADLNNKKTNNKVPTFAYAGSLTKGIRDPREFLEYLVNFNKKFKFICYTRDKVLFTPYMDALGEKLEIRDYIPREMLLEKLSTMDFLINFENRERVQSPSKLIDYAIIGRPIIQISSSGNDWKIFNEFLDNNYTNKFILPDLSKYNIENVAKQFLNL